jgi:adenine-specific DNA-methyltransferase
MADNIRWGLDNPHPFSQMKTELIWEGKYDEYGNRRAVDIAGSAMPLQKIETVDQPRSEAAASGQIELFEKENKRLDDFRNMLIWGDNKLIMASLLKDYKGKIDLIYIDPPFDVGADFTMNVPVGDGKETLGKDQSALEMVAYRDMWGKGTDSYLHMMHERLVLMREFVSENGSIYESDSSTEDKIA